MRYLITAPVALHVDVKLPASKSISNRALIINALAGGRDMPKNLSDCDDTLVTINALRDMPEVIDIMAAGTAMRFLTAYLAVTPGRHTITGTERMKHRPIKILVDALHRLGAEISYAGEEGYPPLTITGRRLAGGAVDIPGNVSSQYISALLMIGPTLEKGLRLRLTGEIISRPYIDLTLWIMVRYGAEVEWTDIDTIVVSPKPYRSTPYYVESDWSAASYWYEMMAIAGTANNTGRALENEALLKGLTDGSRQGDSIARYISSLLGVNTSFVDNGDGGLPDVKLRCTGRRLPRLEYDFVSSPDLTQTFVVCCAALGTPFRFTGLQTLKIKETDRIEALKCEMRKVGYVIKDVDGRELVWNGERCRPDDCPVIDTYEDHRMALAFTPLALRIGHIRINNPQVVTKSYPHFWDDIRQAGFSVVEEDL